jgi:hypothetical protein
MRDKPEDKAKLRRESLQLQRLARMVDVIMIKRSIQWFTGRI